MTKQEGQLLGNMDNSTAFWQHRHNPAEYERQQPNQQGNQNADDTWILFLGILFVVGFLALLAITTLRTIL